MTPPKAAPPGTPPKAAPEAKKRPKPKDGVGRPRAGTSLSPTPWIRRIQRRKKKKKQSASSRCREEPSSSSELLDTQAPSAAFKKEVVPSQEEVLELGRQRVEERAQVRIIGAGRAEDDGARRGAQTREEGGSRSQGQAPSR